MTFISQPERSLKDYRYQCEYSRPTDIDKFATILTAHMYQHCPQELLNLAFEHFDDSHGISNSRFTYYNLNILTSLAEECPYKWA